MVGTNVDEKQLKQISEKVILETTNGQKHKVTLDEFLEAIDHEVVGVKMSAGY